MLDYLKLIFHFYLKALWFKQTTHMNEKIWINQSKSLKGAHIAQDLSNVHDLVHLSFYPTLTHLENY